MAQTWAISFDVDNQEEHFDTNLVNVSVDSVSMPVSSRRNSTITITLNAGQHKVELTHVGYISLTFDLTIQADTSISCMFNPQNTALNEVRVFAQNPFDVRTPEMGIQKISIEEINKLPVLMGEVDIQRGLQTLAGVSSVGEGANGLNIRGGNVDQNLLVLDGNPIYNPTHLFGLFSAIPGEAIRSVKLYKGSVPVQYGGRTASVIDVITKEPDLNHSSIEGGLGLIASKLSIITPIIKNKLGILVTARSTLASNLSKQFKNLENYQGRFSELYGRIKFQPNTLNKLLLSYYGTTDHVTFKGLSINSEGNSALDSKISFTVQNLSLAWHTAFKDNRQFLNASVTSATYKPSIISPDSSLTIQIDNIILKQNSKIEYIKVSESLGQFNIGGEVGLNYISPGTYYQDGSLVSSLAKEKSRESALFMSWQFSPTPKVNADLGFRYSLFNNLGSTKFRTYNDNSNPSDNTVIALNQIAEGKIFNTYHGLEPRISLAYLLSEKSSLKASYTVNRQYIQIAANNTTPLPISRWKTADKFLKPQISSQYSLGYYKNFEESNLSVSIETYFKRTKNYIDIKMGSDFLMKEFVETELLQGQNRAYGLEFMLKKDLGNSIFSINYTYSRSLNRVRGNSFLNQINGGNWFASNIDRPHCFNANIKIQQSPIHHFSFAFTFSSGRPFTAPENLIRLENRVVPVYGSRNTERIPAYHRLDFAWTINNPSQKKGKYRGSWSFNVYNLYAHKNIYSVFFNNRIGSVQAYRLSVFASAIPSLSYNFKIK
ncbi:TonB-dependent receptor plug domain-containing protein [Marinilongibacter aquaticus]|uniref:TonB-dependent receptor plug domain-containing protein n=1 Tax=Marinilongibacter aquaticus TaxID=2975157 RepID=UPI0021BDBF2A|nr:TonB-dependent receptor [Marinilongibacter aquaticus]UBM58689.1 TonB-dependent receptor plug domain-containing protein [Marinilongibacter aquaticus]